MTSVRIIVEDRLLGDVTIDQDDRTGSWDPERQKRIIRDQLALALTKINRAYDLPPYTTKENPND